MPRSKAFSTLALLASLSTLALAGATQAQPAPGGPNAAPRAEFRAQMQQRMTERRAERTKDLATVLRLRPDQMGALQAFIASQAPQRGAGDQVRGQGRRGDRGTLTTPQRLDEQARRGQDRQAMMQRRTQSLRTFYAALSPDQQQVFDALGRLRGSHGARGRGGRGDHGDRGGFRGGRGVGPGGPGGPPPPAPPR